MREIGVRELRVSRPTHPYVSRGERSAVLACARGQCAETRGTMHWQCRPWRVRTLDVLRLSFLAACGLAWRGVVGSEEEVPTCSGLCGEVGALPGSSTSLTSSSDSPESLRMLRMRMDLNLSMRRAHGPPRRPRRAAARAGPKRICAQMKLKNLRVTINFSLSLLLAPIDAIHASSTILGSCDWYSISVDGRRETAPSLFFSLPQRSSFSMCAT